MVLTVYLYSSGPRLFRLWYWDIIPLTPRVGTEYMQQLRYEEMYLVDVASKILCLYI